MYDALFMNIVRDNTIAPEFMDSLGQHSIASYLSLFGYKAMVFSGRTCDVEHVVWDAISNDVSLIGLYVSADTLALVKNIIRWIKKSFNIKVSIGGPEAVSCNEAFMRETGCDAVIVSEGEEPVRQLLDAYNIGDMEMENIPNCRYIDKDNVYHENAVTYCVKELDSIPFPNYNNSLNVRFRRGEMVGILTGRGCPFGCSFCYEGANSKNVRFRSIKNVMAEIDYIIENNPNLRIINIYDDTFTLLTERVYSFCTEIQKRNVEWVCEAHVSNIVRYPEMIKTMVESGLIGIQIGIESGSNKVLKAYNKNIDRQEILKAVKICKEAGVVSLAGNFIIGGAFEDLTTFADSLDLAKEMVRAGRGMVELRSVYLAPYPNTRISEEPEIFGLHIDAQLTNNVIYSMHNPVLHTDALTIDDIYDLRNKFNQEIELEYYREAYKCGRHEIENCIIHNSKTTNRLLSWYEFYIKIEHLLCYIQNYPYSPHDFNMYYYPIRTYCDPEYPQRFHLDITDMEYHCLMLCNGKNSLLDISQKLLLSEKEMESIYSNLYDKCLVYLSKF